MHTIPVSRLGPGSLRNKPYSDTSDLGVRYVPYPTLRYLSTSTTLSTNTMATSTATTTSAASPSLLTATYTSPSNPAFTHTHAIPAPPTDSPSDRTVYLKQLRAATATLQETINQELTARMEADNERAAGSAGGEGKRVVDDGKAEELYGEELVEEDD